ncbi:hypothetical protein T484DRAFT_1815033 [Baffinella frigidus]|nr:hypothetical protein T484DRAFT_1815033 [Cryptophyta sp. CCMP2293]
MGEGAAVEVQFADGVWYCGRLVERVAGTDPPRWKVQFDDGELKGDMLLGNPLLRFDAGAYGATVEVRFDGEWCRGRLVELVKGSDQWGVAFENGGWVQDVRLGDADVRSVFAGADPAALALPGAIELTIKTPDKRELLLASPATAAPPAAVPIVPWAPSPAAAAAPTPGQQHKAPTDLFAQEVATEPGNHPVKAASTKSRQLTVDTALEIYRLRPKMESLGTPRRGSMLHHAKEVAPRFAVSANTVRDVWSGRSWARATRPEWSAVEIAARVGSSNDGPATPVATPMPGLGSYPALSSWHGLSAQGGHASGMQGVASSNSAPEVAARLGSSNAASQTGRTDAAALALPGAMKLTIKTDDKKEHPLALSGATPSVGALRGAAKLFNTTLSYSGVLLGDDSKLLKEGGMVVVVPAASEGGRFHYSVGAAATAAPPAGTAHMGGPWGLLGGGSGGFLGGGHGGLFGGGLGGWPGHGLPYPPGGYFGHPVPLSMPGAAPNVSWSMAGGAGGGAWAAAELVCPGPPPPPDAPHTASGRGGLVFPGPPPPPPNPASGGGEQVCPGPPLPAASEGARMEETGGQGGEGVGGYSQSF